jgi:hypothetical protein
LSPGWTPTSAPLRDWLVNLAVKEAARRYSPAEVVAVTRDVVSGVPSHISTSYVECQNLTLRMTQKRFARLTNGFSKKLNRPSEQTAGADLTAVVKTTSVTCRTVVPNQQYVCTNQRVGRISTANTPFSATRCGLRQSLTHWLTRLARAGRFVEPDQCDLGCPVLSAKRFPFLADPNHFYIAPSRPTEGRFAIVTDVGNGMRWTRRRWAREMTAGRVHLYGLVSGQTAS